MTFLLAFWRPIAAVVGVLILFAGLMALKHSYDDGKRDEGRAEIRAEWDKDIERRREQVATITLQWDQQRQIAEKAQQENSDDRSKRLTDARERVRTLPAAVASVSVPALALRVLDDAVADSNRAATPGPAAEPIQARPAVAADPANDSSVGLVSQWAIEVIGLYDSCRAQVDGWKAFYGGLQAAQP